MQSPAYKFLPPDRETYLRDGLLRFSQPVALNDPFESANYLPEPLNEQFISRLATMPAEKSRELRSAAGLKQLLKDFTLKFGEKFGILSLSDQWNSSLMWAHYTDRHRGFCVGFRLEHPFFGEASLQKTKLCPVTYGRSRIDFQDELDHVGVRMIFYKSSDWAYEEELRMAFFWQREGSLQVTESENEHPPGVPIRLIGVPHESICELMVGMESESELTRQVCELGAKLKVPVFEVHPSMTRLSLERKQLF